MRRAFVRSLGLVGLAGLAGFVGAVAAPARAGEPEADVAAPRLVLERVVADRYAAPLLSAPAWRPGRAELTFLRREPGRGEVLVGLDVETGKERPLLRFSDLDAGRDPKATEVDAPGIGRARMPRFQWTPSGDALVVAHRGDLWFVAPEGGERTRLTRTTSPIADVRIAPDGRRVCFARDFDLWAVVPGEEWKTVPVTSGGSDDLRNGGLDWVYPEELGCETGVWWSPDSSRVAFLQLDERGVRRVSIPDALDGEARASRQPYPLPGGRNPVARVGVVAVREDGPATVAWLDLGERAEYVPWAAWTSDGKGVLVATVDRPQRRMAIRLCDPTSGAGRDLAVEEEPSPGWIEPPEPPLVLRGTAAFVWRRPRAGWWRPVLVATDGSGPAQGVALTTGAFDVDRLVGVDEKAGVLYYEGGHGDATQRGLFRVALSGGDPVEVTTTRGWHRTDVDPSSRWFLDTWSSASRAPRQAVFSLPDGRPVRPIADAETDDLRRLDLPAPELSRATLADGTVVHTRLRKPRDFDPERRYPVVVSVYGGPTARTVRDEWSGLFDAYLAQEGFLVFSLDNRGSSGCGRAFETLVCGRLGRLEIEDQVAGVEHLKQQPWVDGSRVGIWGWSYGGTMACLALTRTKGVFRAGAAVAPVTDWRLYDSIYTERYLGLPAENPSGYADGSPHTHAPHLEGALLLCHGLADDNVHVQNTTRFVDALVAKRKPFDLMVYPRRGHGIEGDEARLDLFGRIHAHFARHLAGGAPRR